MDFDEAEDKIEKALERICARGQEQTDTWWTEEIILAVGQIGEVLDCAVSSSKHNMEWLYDLIWYRKENGPFTELVLAMESEWNLEYSNILYDFEKLIQARAGLRVMIFQSTGAMIEERVGDLKAAVRAFRGSQKGDRYLFAVYNRESKGFHFEQFRC